MRERTCERGPHIFILLSQHNSFSSRSAPEQAACVLGKYGCRGAALGLRRALRRLHEREVPIDEIEPVLPQGVLELLGVLAGHQLVAELGVQRPHVPEPLSAVLAPSQASPVPGERVARGAARIKIVADVERRSRSSRLRRCSG